MLLAWAYEFKPEVEKVKLTLIKLIDGDFLINLDSILEWVVPRVGICIKEGDDQEELLPFVRGPEDEIKDQCRERARVGWEAMKLYVKLTRVDEVLNALDVVARMKVGRDLRDRFEEGWAIQLLASLEGDPDFECLDCIPRMKGEAAKGKAPTTEEGREEATQGDSE